MLSQASKYYHLLLSSGPLQRSQPEKKSAPQPAHERKFHKLQKEDESFKPAADA